ncbi:MAG: BatD family protein [Cellvibrio sp.]
MKKFIQLHLIASFIASLFWANLALAQSLSSSVNRNHITLNDTLQLIVRYDQSTRTTPDFSALEKDFDILGTVASTNRSIINGRHSVETRWTLTLAPKREGKLLIPSISFENAVSDAILVEVDQAAAASSDSPVLVESNIDKTQGYLQQQFLLTLKIKIRTDVTLAGGQIEPLQIKDALLISFDEKKSRINEGGIEYDVLEYQYAIFPQASGELIIPSQLIQLEIASDIWDSRRLFSTSRGTLQRFRTQETKLTVAPAPQDQRASPWLPAENIQIREHWSSSPENLQVGDPITRTITLTAEGLTGAQLPSLPSLSMEGLNIYQDQAQIDDQKSDGRVVGTRTETSAIVAAKAGDYTLPAINIHWWNTRDQRFETASLPASKISVSSKLSGQPETHASAFNSQAPSLEAVPSESEKTLEDRVTTPQLNSWVWIGLLASIFLNLVLAILLIGSRKNLEYPQTNKNKKVSVDKSQSEQREREAWHQLKQSLKKPEATELRAAIISWANAKLGNSTNSLDSVSKLLDSKAAEQLRLIDKAVFGQGDLNKLDTEVLMSAFKRARSGGAPIKEQLTPLYPH